MTVLVTYAALVIIAMGALGRSTKRPTDILRSPPRASEVQRGCNLLVAPRRSVIATPSMPA